MFLPFWFEGEIRDLRIEVRYRASLVRTRTQVKNKIHASLAREGLQTKFSDLFGRGNGIFEEGGD